MFSWLCSFFKFLLTLKKRNKIKLKKKKKKKKKNKPIFFNLQKAVKFSGKT